MSDGLYKSYQEATGSDQVNKEIAQMVVEQFVEQATITSVAQTVVDKVVRQHHDMFLTRQTRLSGREDITLVVRNFSFRLRGVGGRSHAASGLPGLVPPLTPALREGHAAQRESPPLAASLSPAAASSSDHCCSSTASILHTSSSESSSAEQLQRPSLNPLQLDEDGRIDSYVSFNGYYAAVEDAQRRGLIPEHQLHLYK